MTVKTAYSYGVLRALREIGLVKTSTDTDAPSLHDAVEHNPAEQLAAIFQAANSPARGLAPDNKTECDDSQEDEHSPAWGPPITGTGGEALARNVPGFNMPTNGSI